MNKNPKSDQDEQFWRNHISQWRDSDLTQAAYCKQHDLSPHSISYYKRKFSGGPDPVRRKPAGFVNVQLTPEVVHPAPLTLYFANGVRLSGIAEHNVSVVKQLAQVLS
jgi:hypothetical protein